MIKKINKRKDFVVYCRITNACNYHCSYCIQKKNIKKKEASIDCLINKINNTIDEYYDLFNKQIILVIIGGEPTLLNLNYIFKSLHQNKIKEIRITTNLSQSSEYYISLSKEFKKINYIFSLHLEFISKEDIVKKLKEIRSNTETKIDINMVINKENYNQSVDIIKNLPNGITIKPALEREIGNTISKENEEVKKLIPDTKQRGKFDINGKEYTQAEALCYLTDNNINLKGYYCDINYNVIRINPYGRYMKCFFGEYDKETTLKDIINTPTICEKDKCNLCRVSKISKDLNDIDNA